MNAMHIRIASGLLAASSLMAIAAPAAAQANAAAQVTFNIPPGDLTGALQRLARQSRTQVIYSATDLRGRRTQGVSGRLSAAEALQRLVQGSGAVLVHDSSGAFLVRASHGSGEAQVGGAAADNRGAEEEIIVTGTNIRGAAPESSPVIVYSREDIRRTGAQTTSQFVRTIPQNLAMVDSSTASGAGSLTANNVDAGQNVGRGSAVNLRGLGGGATLVLLNGNRLAPSGSGGSFADVSMIPLAAVQRVELLTDGASAIYGADAVAGVANFILRRDYVGFETAVRGSLATSGGAENFGADQTAGLAWGSGNLLASYSFNRDGPLRTSERSYVNSPSASTGDFDLLPRQTQHNALLHLRQDIGPNVEISADSLYGYRRFRAISNTASVDGITTDERGRTQQYSVSGNIKVNLSDWQFVIDSNYSNVDQNFVETFLADYLPPEGSLFTVLTNTNLLEFDARAEGPVAHLPGGAARLAVGGSYRRETFVDHIDADGFTVLEVNSRRHLYSVFAEFHAPIIGGDSGMPSLRRLEVTAAGRYDSYSDFGSSWNPKVGVLWAPTRDVVFRSTFARSFRAPALQQLSEANRQYGLFPIPDPTAPDGVTNTLVTLAIGNSSLGPERSNSFTAGTDITFRALDNLRLSITFFNIDYRGRIGNPPVIGSLFNIFQQEDTLAPYIKRSPDPAEIARIFATELVLSGGVFPVTPDKVEAQFDNRPQNIASSRFRGLDFLLSYSKNMSVGTISATANVAYIATLNFRPAAGVPVVDLVDTIYNPPRWRARATMDWQRRSIGAGLNISYVDSYANNLITPAGEVPSWTTVGAHLAYTIGSARGRGLDIFFSVENLLNQRPPRVTGTITPFFNIGYDPTNASALGRVLALSVVKRW